MTVIAILIMNILVTSFMIITTTIHFTPITTRTILTQCFEGSVRVVHGIRKAGAVPLGRWWKLAVRGLGFRV